MYTVYEVLWYVTNKLLSHPPPQIFLKVGAADLGEISGKHFHKR